MKAVGGFSGYPAVYKPGRRQAYPQARVSVLTCPDFCCTSYTPFLGFLHISIPYYALLMLTWQLCIDLLETSNAG